MKVRPRRLLSKVVAAAFLLLALQQAVAVPLVRASARIEQGIARSSAAQKWKEALPAPAVATLPDRHVEAPRRHATQENTAPQEAFYLRRFQRPPPIL